MKTSLKLGGKAWKNFEDTETSAKTKELYTRMLAGFMEYCKIKDPDKLLEIGTIHQIEDKIIQWIGTMKAAGRATASMRTALAGVIFFYSCNRVKLDSKFIARKIPKKPALPHRSPTKEEIVPIVEATTIRGKALIGSLASSGTRIGAIALLKIRHRRKAKPRARTPRLRLQGPI